MNNAGVPRHPSPANAPPAKQGVALVIVLAFLVLLSGLVVAFLNSMQTETQAAKSYEHSTSVKQLVHSATNLVIGQISDATKSAKTPGLPGAVAKIPPGERLTWASQPGMIRTWDDAGKGWKIFKLYSAQDMVADFRTGDVYQTGVELAQEIPETWPEQTARFADLNEPVVVSDAKGKIVRDNKNYRASWPIVDPLALRQVEGFRITNPPGYAGPPTDSLTGISESYDPSVRTSPGKTGNPAPMPVSWMYVLQDGTLTVPTGSEDNGRTATWKGASPAFTPSRSNPIVGRYAFWADDETCKINLNTASEPTPWDTPRAVTIQDLNYGRFQPAQKEYQRYAGHPFMTALSPVLFPTRIPGQPNKPNLTSAQKELIYGIVPRVAAGGTRGGTVDVNAATKVVPDEDRLFASVDEFLFSPTRKALPDETALKPLGLDANKLRRARFFLTANSRAPELNLYGQPRISLWPEHATANLRTAYDKLAAFCTTLGEGNTGNYYYFQRSNATSQTTDWTLKDSKNQLRNQQLYKYLQTVTEQPIPGYGGNFKDKWKDDRDQLLTQIFDYVRCTNLRDPQPGATKYSDRGQVAPIQINDTKGFGRVHSLSQFGLHFICSRDGATGVPGANLPEGERWIEAALLFQPFSPSQGWYKIAEDMFFEVQFLTPLAITDAIGSGDFKFPTTPVTARLDNRIGSGWHNNGRERGGAGGLRGPIQGFGGSGYVFTSKVNPRVRVSTAGGKKTMNFSGGSIRVKVYTGGSANAANLVQTFDLNIPAGNFPIPDLVRTGTDDYRGGGASTVDFWWTFAQRYSSTGSTPHAPGTEYFRTERRWASSDGPPGFKRGGLFRQEDVVRTIVPEHGDLRLVAAQKTISGAQFVPVHRDLWSDPNTRFLHIFSEAVGTHTLFGNCNEPGPSPAIGIPGANSTDQLHGSADVKYHYSRLPEIRPGAGLIYNKWGDFDNGIAQSTDGAFINKPDEGNTKATNSPYAYFSWDFSEPTEVFFSPNRLVPSAGMLGSLPTGVKRNQPWQTLLFRPEKGHPGEDPKFPKDHLIMDLFWMPVIEPYAISEPFSTAGKINLNYEIAPFSYIRRATALHGAMKSEEPLAIPNTASKAYKLWDHETNDNPRLPNNALNTDAEVREVWDKLYNGRAPFDKLRRPIDAELTLAQADERFANGQVFRSATEICELHLVREGETLAPYRNGTYWRDYRVTGDNTRERPYANLYAKLTTRSNTFTVHVRAQVLKQTGGTNADGWAVWREGRDQVAGEFRGSSIVERYIDPADSSLVDFATTPDAVADAAYRFRVVSTKKFVP